MKERKKYVAKNKMGKNKRKGGMALLLGADKGEGGVVVGNLGALSWLNGLTETRCGCGQIEEEKNRKL